METADDSTDRGVSRSVWRFARAERLHIAVDAAAYFEAIQQAMAGAQQRIMLIGWDFDTRILLGQARAPGDRAKPRYPARLGAFIAWLAWYQPGVAIMVLRWNFGALKFLLRGTMLLDLIRWRLDHRVAFRLDSAHPVGCSHHQKLVVIDDAVAACGGIDMTGDRWDTPEHLEDDPRRRLRGHAYGPWHDMSMLAEGELASALGDLARRRWQRAGGPAVEPCAPVAHSLWPPGLDAEFRDVEVGIARTRAAWKGAAEIREVEALHLEHIARAKRLIYAESQYFASRRIAEAMARRLAEPDPPEIVLITSLHSIGWLQQQAMDATRVRLVRALAACDHAGRFHAYVPLASKGTPIYVHSKLTIIDDEVVRVGSANLNNRSMGLDTECDLFIDALRPGNAAAASEIAALRHRLLAEHCALKPEQVAAALAAGSTMAALIAAAPQDGKRLIALPLPPLSEAEKAIADTGLLDAERPDEIFEPIGRRRGLFRRGGYLRRPS